LLEIDNLTVSYGTERAVDKISLKVSGEVVCLCGRNGAGKSTVLKAVAGVVGVDSGRIWMNGQDVITIPLFKRLKSGIGYVPEDRKLFKEMTVRENIEVARIGGRVPGRKETNIDQLLPELTSLYSRKSKLLSGGQQKIISIARAIVTSPGILLFDELLEGLARSMMIRISEIVMKLKAEGKDILCAESSLDKASYYADRIVWLEKGRTLATGSPSEIKKQMMDAIRAK